MHNWTREGRLLGEATRNVGSAGHNTTAALILTRGNSAQLVLDAAMLGGRLDNGGVGRDEREVTQLCKAKEAASYPLTAARSCHIRSSNKSSGTCSTPVE